MFWTNYRNTVVYTVVATVIAMVLTTCYAYVLSKQHLRAAALLVGDRRRSPCSSTAA